MKIGVICFTARGCRTALELREVLTGPEEGDPQENQIRIWCKKKDFIPPKGIERVEGSLREWTGQQFERNEALIYTYIYLRCGLSLRFWRERQKTRRF